MKLLVTGGAGYIGSHTAAAFIKSGYQVFIFDNLTTGFRDAMPKGSQFLFGDVRDSDQLKFILNKEQIKGVIHLAAKLVVPESMQNPADYYDNNVGGVIALTKACKAAQVQNIVFSSTAAVYSGSDSKPVTEESSTHPISPYGQSKLMSEKILADAEKAYGIRSAILRYFNVAGASGENGHRTANATHLIKVCAEAACGKRPYVEVFGTDYPTTDGSCVRDYIHVEDLAQLHVLAFKYLEQGNPGTVLNCGYGKGFSVLDVIKTMQSVSGKNFEVKLAPRREGDLPIVLANSTKAQNLLKWDPKFNDLSLICKSAYEWEKKLTT